MPPLRVAVTFPAERSAQPIDGRLLLLISAETEGEPRLQVNDSAKTAQVFGVDVEAWKPGEPRTVDATAFGYPIRSLAAPSQGHVPGPGAGQSLRDVHARRRRHREAAARQRRGPAVGAQTRQPLLAPRRLTVDPSSAKHVIRLALDQEVPPVDDFAKQETKYVKYVRVRSERLSTFWGRDMFLAAWVLLPWGFDDHPDARYPLVIDHGHFPSSLAGWRETPPDPDLKPDFSERFQLAGYNRIQQELAHQFYKDWTGPGFPASAADRDPAPDAVLRRLVRGELGQQRAVRRRDHVRAGARDRAPLPRPRAGLGAVHLRRVDRRLGSHGRADVLPGRLQRRVGRLPRSRSTSATTPSSTSTTTTNAYYQEGPFKRVPRPGLRNYLGHVTTTLEQMNHRELALGTRTRSGDQWDVWESVYSPRGADGYPKPIWNKLTGQIDKEVAAYWREHFDLSHILRARLADAWARSCAASCASTSATWTTTT